MSTGPNDIERLVEVFPPDAEGEHEGWEFRYGMVEAFAWPDPPVGYEVAIHIDGQQWHVTWVDTVRDAFMWLATRLDQISTETALVARRVEQVAASAEYIIPHRMLAKALDKILKEEK